MGARTMSTFACIACRSPSFTLDGDLKETTLARCAGCGATLGSWSYLRRQIERRVVLNEMRSQAAHDTFSREPGTQQPGAN